MEALFEHLPDVGAQSVAATEPQLVARLDVAWRRVDQVAAQLADIDEQGALLPHHVIPETARRKTLPDTIVPPFTSTAPRTATPPVL